MTTVNRYGKSISGYWGSPLNKWIDLNCPHDFTCINIDCFELKFETKQIRFIEYKRAGETLGDQQRKALQVLAHLLGGLELEGWTFEILVIEGDEPFIDINILDLSSTKRLRIKGHFNIVKYLSLGNDNHDKQ